MKRNKLHAANHQAFQSKDSSLTVKQSDDLNDGWFMGKDLYVWFKFHPRANLTLLAFFALFFSCTPTTKKEEVKEEPLIKSIVQTSATGDKLTELDLSNDESESTIEIKLDASQKFQRIEGFGGSFTEATAHLWSRMSEGKQQELINAYFSAEGANYTMARTHINSSDFSLSNYAYAPVAGDTALKSFSIEADMDDIVPMIKAAQKTSPNGFKVLASPWTAPPWMKDNKEWNGGKLLPEYYPAWAKYFSKYINASGEQGIDIWGLTVENEPLGNDSNWESMHYTPEEMADFVKNHLGPQLKADGLSPKVYVFDQNRDHELKQWADVLLTDEKVKPYIHGTAVHWYASTFKWFPEALNYVHDLAPDMHIIQSEACVDAEVPHWQDDAWYWSREATDWGWDWAKEEDKLDHPKYVPTYRYARDIIGCMNSWVEGWIDWNMILDKQGGPNHAKNWCVAPVIVDPDTDEIYYTPLYYVMAHFSKYIRPGAVRIGFDNTNPDDLDLMVTAAQNPDGSIAVVILNMAGEAKTFTLTNGGKSQQVTIDKQTLQTIVL
jgi:glucosylceramidase